MGKNSLVIKRGTTEVYRFPYSQIVFIEADVSWCKVYTSGYPKNCINPLPVPLLLKDIWGKIHNDLKLTEENIAIVRCGRSLLINPEYVRMIDVSKKTLILSDGINYYDLKVSREALIELKTLF